MYQAVALHILLVDDDVDSRLLVQATLEGFGYRVSTAANGHEALDACARENYDLILMDLDMPEMDGLEAAREIRQIEQGVSPTRYTPIVALSGYVEAIDQEKCEAAGIDDSMSKKLIEPDVLQKRLEHWFSLKKHAYSAS